MVIVRTPSMLRRYAGTPIDRRYFGKRIIGSRDVIVNINGRRALVNSIVLKKVYEAQKHGKCICMTSIDKEVRSL